MAVDRRSAVRSFTRWFSGSPDAAAYGRARRLRISASSVAELDSDEQAAARAENEGYPLGRRDPGEGPPAERLRA
jgi:hypothetical protein